jgi:hypothetical protein
MALTEFDDLLFQQPPARRVSMYNSADLVLEALGLTYVSIADELTAYEQSDLSADDEASATRALQRAAWWMLAKLRKTEYILEDFLPQDATMVKDILVSRAIYGLMLSTGQSGVAAERRISIREMATALFGPEFWPDEQTGTSAASAPGTPAGGVARIPRKRYP